MRTTWVTGLLVLGFLSLIPAEWAMAQQRPAHRRMRYSDWHEPQRRPRGFYQEPRRLFYVGAGPLVNIAVESANELSRLVESGAGGTLFFGFRLNDYFGLETGFTGAAHPTGLGAAPYSLGILHSASLDGRVFLLPDSRRIEPFVQIGFGGYGFFEEGYEGLDLKGMGFHLGGGADFRIARRICIGTRALYRGLSLTNATSWFENREEVFQSLFSLEGNVQFEF